MSQVRYRRLTRSVAERAAVKHLGIAHHIWGDKDICAGACVGVNLVGAIIVGVNPEAAEILDVRVHDDWRRRGIATALVGQALLIAKERNLPAVWLEVARKNESARRLYARLGFETIGSRDAYYPDGDDALLMTHSGLEKDCS